MADPAPVRTEILLTGAAGFIGGAVLEGLRRRPELGVNLLLHRRAPGGPPLASGRIVEADLGRPETLAGICRGIGAVIHAASYVGPDPLEIEAVNAAGTEALAAQAWAAGVGRFVYVSSAAVYGYAVHRGAKEIEASVCPATPISRSRVRAERAVLGAGGLVVRPLFVYGRGDTRFLPVIIRTMDRLPFLINGGRARVSVISAEDLAAALIALATEAEARPLQGVFHATDGRPVSLREIADALSRTIGMRRPAASLPLAIARPVLQWAGRRSFGRSDPASFRHRLFLIAKDHFYDSSRLWERISAKPGAALPDRLPEFAGWYRTFLGPGRPEAGR